MGQKEFTCKGATAFHKIAAGKPAYDDSEDFDFDDVAGV